MRDEPTLCGISALRRFQSMNTTSQSRYAVDVVLATAPSSFDKEFGILSGGGAFRPPLNLLNLGAVLLENDYSVHIADGVKMGNARDFTNKVTELNPRYIGLTSMTAHIHSCGQIAEQLRKNLPHARIIVGGVHITTLPEETMRMFPAFDVGVVGEGDRTIIELIKGLDDGEDLSQIKGLVLRDGDDIQMTPPRELIKDLDSLPMPAWHLLPDYVQTYQPTLSRRTRLPSAYIVTSRGCPFSCTFCTNEVHGRTFRSYSVDYIMDMISHLVDTYEIRDLTIYDENLALNKKRIASLCQRLIESNYDLTWSCDARVDSVDDEILRLMSEAGCRSIWFGMESGNQDILERYDKRITLEDCQNAVTLCKKNRIKAAGSFIIGGPEETRETIRDTIRFARRLKLDYFVPFFYTPIPGTPDYKDITKYGTCDLDYRSATMTQPTFAPHGMTFKDIRYWYIRAFLSFYSQPRVIFQEIRSIGLKQVIVKGTVSLLSILKASLWRILGRPGKARKERIAQAVPLSPSLD
jgi:anaerobic magnesium-protoporphyrin IX monomethyl ester cyclase